MSFKLLSTPFPQISCVLASGEDALTCPCNSPYLKPQSKSQEAEETKEGVLEGDRGAKPRGSPAQHLLPRGGSLSPVGTAETWVVECSRGAGMVVARCADTF